MNKALYALIVIVLSGCSDREHGAQKQVEKAGKFYRTSDTITRFFPQKDEISVTDTVIQGPPRIRIVVHTRTDRKDIAERFYENDNGGTARDVYRGNTSSVHILVDDTTLLKEEFHMSSFPVDDPEFLEEAVSSGTWFSAYDKESGTITFLHSLNVPETCWSYLYKIIVTPDGKYRIELDEVN